MIRRLRSLLALPLVAAGACGAQPIDPTGNTPGAPVAAAPTPQAARADPFAGATVTSDGRTLTIVAAGHARVTLVPVKLTGRRAGIVAQCALTIDGDRLITVGEGDTEAYGCTHLVAAGALPAKDGRSRIGLIYDVSSPNADFRTALILVADGGHWAVDPASVGTYDDTPAARSIAALRRAAR